MPRMIWERMTPLLPRAPVRAPRLSASADAVQVAAVLRQALRLRERGPHRGQHVGAGVTVGDGEDVEGVDLVDVRLEVRHGGRHRPDHGRPIDEESGHRCRLDLRSTRPTSASPGPAIIA